MASGPAVLNWHTESCKYLKNQCVSSEATEPNQIQPELYFNLNKRSVASRRTYSRKRRLNGGENPPEAQTVPELRKAPEVPEVQAVEMRKVEKQAEIEHGEVETSAETLEQTKAAKWQSTCNKCGVVFTEPVVFIHHKRHVCGKELSFRCAGEGCLYACSTLRCVETHTNSCVCASVVTRNVTVEDAEDTVALSAVDEKSVVATAPASEVKIPEASAVAASEATKPKLAAYCAWLSEIQRPKSATVSAKIAKRYISPSVFGKIGKIAPKLSTPYVKLADVKTTKSATTSEVKKLGSTIPTVKLIEVKTAKLLTATAASAVKKPESPVVILVKPKKVKLAAPHVAPSSAKKSELNAAPAVKAPKSTAPIVALPEVEPSRPAALLEAEKPEQSSRVLEQSEPSSVPIQPSVSNFDSYPTGDQPSGTLLTCTGKDCDFVTNSMSNFASHKKNFCGRDYLKLTCTTPSCGYTTFSATRFRTHIKICTGDKKEGETVRQVKHTKSAEVPSVIERIKVKVEPDLGSDDTGDVKNVAEPGREQNPTEGGVAGEIYILEVPGALVWEAVDDQEVEVKVEVPDEIPDGVPDGFTYGVETADKSSEAAGLLRCPVVECQYASTCRATLIEHVKGDHKISF